MGDMKEAEISLKVVIDREKSKSELSASRSDPSHQPVNIGSFNNLYASVANLDAKYYATNECKDMLLNTRNSAEALCCNLKINIDDTKPIQYFICERLCFHIYSDHAAYLSTYSTLKCKSCGNFLSKAVHLNATDNDNKDDEGVFVADTSSFVISDDLRVIPNNPASTLAILESIGIKDFDVLEENKLQLGPNEILNLLERTFLSKTPLSDIFFGKWTSSPVPTIQSPIGTEGTDSKKMTVKVFVQKSTNMILLAHSSEDFIEFLFSFLTVPVGKVTSMLTENHESKLSIENMYKSVIELNVSEYLKSQHLKDMLLKPKLPMHHLCSNYIFPLMEETASKKFGIRCMPFSRGQYDYYLTAFSDSTMKLGRECIDQSPKGEGGFVRGPTKFMVTDDLVVTPLSSMSCFTYFHRLKVAPGDIEEQVINIGMEEALNLLWASLTSTSVLTNGLKFFISKNRKQETSPNKPKSDESLKKVKVEK
ncbi:hypothetical protein POM88_030125 [Heracleum sosnowskyi]|uniref:DUF674 family protein n=1 Tax=Heracleum sosnowskyi TaxID=360622 RepID=A0AAD8HWU5_9APIA|nr:hypothetical protein POM88_030125 [Heracleum sosnowskyi]